MCRKRVGWDPNLEKSRTGFESAPKVVLFEHISTSSSSEKLGLFRSWEMSFVS